MAQRLELQAKLLEIMEGGKVYFQPPPTVKMSYPCIVYKRSRTNTIFADDLPYGHISQYEVTVIDSNPDSDIPARLAMLPMCIHERSFTADQLNHEVFNLFF